MVLIQVPLLYDYVLINDLGDSIDLVHRQQVTSNCCIVHQPSVCLLLFNY